MPNLAKIREGAEAAAFDADIIADLPSVDGTLVQLAAIVSRLANIVADMARQVET
jgi:hypothetical protein